MNIIWDFEWTLVNKIFQRCILENLYSAGMLLWEMVGRIFFRGKLLSLHSREKYLVEFLKGEMLSGEPS